MLFKTLSEGVIQVMQPEKQEILTAPRNSERCI